MGLLARSSESLATPAIPLMRRPGVHVQSPRPPSSAGERVFGLAEQKRSRRVQARAARRRGGAEPEGSAAMLHQTRGSGEGRRYNFRLDFFTPRRSGMASQKGPIRVVHFSLGPIGAGVVRQVAARKIQDRGAVDIDPAKVDAISARWPPSAGRSRSGFRTMRRRRLRRRSRMSSSVHQFVDEGRARPDRVDPEAQGADRVDDRGAGLSDEGQHALRAGRAPDGEEGEGGRARDRGESGLRHGCAADHADRRVRARRGDQGGTHPGRAHPQAPVPAEDRRRPDPRTVPEEGGRWQRAPRRAGRIGLDDCRRARMEARSHHRRHPAEDGHRNRGERVPGRRPGVCVPESCRTGSATRATSRSSPCTWRRIWAPGVLRLGGNRRLPAFKSKVAGVHGDIATASIVVNSLPKILEVAPGLHTMRDMPLPSFFGGVR